MNRALRNENEGFCEFNAEQCLRLSISVPSGLSQNNQGYDGARISGHASSFDWGKLQSSCAEACSFRIRRVRGFEYEQHASGSSPHKA